MYEFIEIHDIDVENMPISINVSNIIAVEVDSYDVVTIVCPRISYEVAESYEQVMAMIRACSLH